MGERENSKAKGIAVGAAVLAGVVVVTWLLGGFQRHMQKASSTRPITEEEGAVSSASPDPVSRPRGFDDPDKAGKPLASRRWRISRKAAERFLEQAGRSADNLVAAFHLTTDGAYLEELRRTSNSSGIALLTLALCGGDGETYDPACAARWREIEPQNGAAALVEAVTLAGGDAPPDQGELSEQMRLALEKPDFDLYFRELDEAKMAMLDSAGIPSEEAREIVAERNAAPRVGFLYGVGNLIDPILQGSGESFDHEANGLLELIERIGRESNPSHPSVRYGQALDSLELKIMRNLPADTLLGRSGMTASEREAWLNEKMRESQRALGDL